MCDVQAEPAESALWVELRIAEPDDRIALATLLRQAAGESSSNWVLSEQLDRDIIHLTGLWRLVKAAGAGLFAYLELPAFSPERSAILLRGAFVLEIPTDWKGWA